MQCCYSYKALIGMNFTLSIIEMLHRIFQSNKNFFSKVTRQTPPSSLVSHVKVRLPWQKHTACKLSPSLRAVRWKITFDSTCMKMSAVITSTYHRFLSVFVSKCFSGFCSVLSRISTPWHLAVNQQQLRQSFLLWLTNQDFASWPICQIG